MHEKERVCLKMMPHERDYHLQSMRVRSSILLFISTVTSSDSMFEPVFNSRRKMSAVQTCK
jgi:hypothetical protein